MLDSAKNRICLTRFLNRHVMENEKQEEYMLIVHVGSWRGERERARKTEKRCIQRAIF